MVRINLINPYVLADQHLIAEYNEILMLLGYVKKTKKIENIPEKYKLGKGHIKFFANKIKYLKQRHEILKIEMKKRGFKPTKTINLKEYPIKLCNNWKSNEEDKKIIKQRIIEKLEQKPNYYKHYSKPINLKKQIKLIQTA
ncbi:pyrimidine dimer DNA glycosylase/endonuclease V [Candidatus Woesearchaeota archaeon]|nr:pyrimidine dimer DNA glycosylase/endonuclease V [Candidatus Woesearchaeota archaeon]MCF8013577.1 pyrimidine dimer DNA glycosylase/endonuclease V [Candidatus Woesearchaeota archaeon]